MWALKLLVLGAYLMVLPSIKLVSLICKKIVSSHFDTVLGFRNLFQGRASADAGESCSPQILLPVQN